MCQFQQTAFQRVHKGGSSVSKDTFPERESSGFVFTLEHPCTFWPFKPGICGTADVSGHILPHHIQKKKGWKILLSWLNAGLLRLYYLSLHYKRKKVSAVVDCKEPFFIQQSASWSSPEPVLRVLGRPFKIINWIVLLLLQMWCLRLAPKMFLKSRQYRKANGIGDNIVIL